jgi:chromosome partitioning protein
MVLTDRALRNAKRTYERAQLLRRPEEILDENGAPDAPLEYAAVLGEIALDMTRTIAMKARTPRSYQVLTVSSNKGGVGKTTIASNLAIYLRALREDLPILILGLDDQPTIDRMFAFGSSAPGQDVETGLRIGSFASALRLGEYGMYYVPSSPDLEAVKGEIRDTSRLLRTLDGTGWNGLVIVDTKSDLEILTRNAIAASDLLLIPVKDDLSLREAAKSFELLRACGLSWDRARVLLSMIDLRIKYRDADERDILALLVSEIRRRGYPLLQSFLSSSPKIEALGSDPSGRALSILGNAPGSIVNMQMRYVASEIVKLLDRVPA